MFKDIYRKKRVLVTGHTGFKGSWLVLWLKHLGADVCGYSLAPDTEPNHFELLNLDINSVFADILDRENLEKVFADFQPEIVFHLAAQSLVRKSYREPVNTFQTNVIGTVNVLEACRSANSVKAVVNVTTDKCYENKEWVWGYRENDPMGGHDPYSASKACSELVTSSYRSSFGGGSLLIASARAGNVIGGGDWAEDRLIPDIMKAASKGEIVKIRNPSAIRPWQHVLDPLSGYLLLGQKLLTYNSRFAEAWNFGPANLGDLTVGELVDGIKQSWNIKIEFPEQVGQPHEATILKLDCSKALSKLKWSPVWGGNDTIQMTAEWYKEFYQSNILVTTAQLKRYIKDAKSKFLDWSVE